jgi:TRAP-type transport system periplasmic protein
MICKSLRKACAPMLAAAGIIAAALGVAQPAAAADFTMKIGFITMNDQNHQWANWYKEAIEKGSNGRIAVQIFPASQLGPAPRMLEGVQLGTIEAVLMPTDFFVGLDARYGIFAIPGLFRDMEHAAKAIADPALNRLLLTLGEDKGLLGISGFVYSAADYLGKAPIRSLADFKGKTFRINATPAERERMRLLGATAVPMPLPEVIPALQRGQIDGTQSAIAVFVNFKFFDIAKTIAQTDDTMLVPVAVVSRPWLDKLPKDLQELVVNEGLKLQGPVQKASFEATEAMRKRWTDAGGEIIKFAPDEQKKLEELLKGVGETVTASDARLSAFYRQVKAIADKH